MNLKFSKSVRPGTFVKKLRLEKTIAEYDHFPKGYGKAWYEVERNRVVCYPVPLNIVFGFAHNTYHWARVCIRPSILDRWYWRAYETGRRIGHFEHAESTTKDLSPVMYEIQRQLARGFVAEETLVRVMGLKKDVNEEDKDMRGYGGGE